MSQANDISATDELISSREIHELAMCSHAYVRKAIWWVRLAQALDLLAEALITADLRTLGRDLAARSPHLSDQALSLEGMGDEALGCIDAARMHVATFAGQDEEALQVRDTVKWVCHRVQLINYLVDDLHRLDQQVARAPRAQTHLRLVRTEQSVSAD